MLCNFIFMKLATRCLGNLLLSKKQWVPN